MPHFQHKYLQHKIVSETMDTQVLDGGSANIPHSIKRSFTISLPRYISQPKTTKVLPIGYVKDVVSA